MRIGIDMGGTKIEVIALQEPEGREIFRKRVPTPREDYSATIQAMCDLVKATETETGQTGSVGIGIPGAVSPATGLIKNANSTWLNGRPYHKDLERALGREIRVANDADCLALSEATDGAGAGEPIVWAVILGTGAGSGLVAHGHLVSGPNAIGGEWGHNPLPWPRDAERPGPSCYCGKNGCIETFVSGTGLQRDYEEAGNPPLPGADIEARARGGEPEALAAMHRYIDRLARATACVINIVDPHVVVLGGGMSNCKMIYESLPGLWGQYLFSDTAETKLKQALHGDSSGVRGAARLWDDSES